MKLLFQQFNTTSENVRPDSPDSDIIIIDDEDENDIIRRTLALNKSISILKNPLKRKLSAEIHTAPKVSKIDCFESEENTLKNLFGEFGGPLNRQLKCPKCNKFKSKRISDFIFHMYKETKVMR